MPQKALYIAKHGTLALADWHLGKAAHFRKHGLPLPGGKESQDYDVLAALLATYRPERVLFLGDLFHSHFNKECERLGHFIQRHPGLDFHLVKGNHDILEKHRYEDLGLVWEPLPKLMDNLVFSHEPLGHGADKGLFNIAGHLHPGCLIMGKARQSYRLPCYYRSGNALVLPAFGSLTGLAMVDRSLGTAYAIVGEAVMPV